MESSEPVAFAITRKGLLAFFVSGLVMRVNIRVLGGHASKGSSYHLHHRPRKRWPHYRQELSDRPVALYRTEARI